MEEICEKLDDLAMRNIQLSNDWIKLNTELESRVKDGWLSLAKIRYISGSNRVCSHLLDERDRQAAVTVDLMNDHSSPLNDFSVVESDNKKECLKELSKGIFGALPSWTLANGCQKQFHASILIVAELATIKSQLDLTSLEYRKLIREKKRLMF